MCVNILLLFPWVHNWLWKKKISQNFIFYHAPKRLLQHCLLYWVKNALQQCEPCVLVLQAHRHTIILAHRHQAPKWLLFAFFARVDFFYSLQSMHTSLLCECVCKGRKSLGTNTWIGKVHSNNSVVCNVNSNLRNHLMETSSDWNCAGA